MQAQNEKQVEFERLLRLFVNSLPSPYTQNHYMFYLDRHLQHFGYQEAHQLLRKDHKEIESEIIEFIIISCKHVLIMGLVVNSLVAIISLVVLLVSITSVLASVFGANKVETLYSVKIPDTWTYETSSNSGAASLLGFGPSNTITMAP